MTSTVNVADVERWASALGGAALTAYGIKQLKDRSPAGAALAAAGGALIYRGATGHCPVYSAAGISTADHDDASAALSDARRSRWVAKAPAGRTVEWDADIINEITGELIEWHTVEGADVVSAGSVRFT